MPFSLAVSLLVNHLMTQNVRYKLCPICTDKVESHLQYLLEVLPGWIKSVKVSKGVFLKINKKADLKTIMEKLERKKKDLS